MIILFSLMTLFAADKEVRVDEWFDVAQGCEFNLDTHKGSIQIRTIDGDRVHVKATVSYQDHGTPVPIEIKARKSGSDVIVEVDEDHDDDSISGIFKKRNTVWPHVHFEIGLPDYASLRIEDHKSSYDLEVPAGRIRIDSHKGRGTIRGIRNALNLDTHKGDFDIVIEELHDLDIDTHKGRIDIDVRKADDVRIRAETHKGDIKVLGRPVEIEDEDNGYKVYYTEGSGSNVVRIDTHKGTVKVHFVN